MHELRFVFSHFQILDKHNTHLDDDAVSPPSSPTPGLKIIQGMKWILNDQESHYNIENTY